MSAYQRVNYQWPFQEPQFEVPIIYKAYISGLWFRGYPYNNMACGTNVPPFQDPGIPIEIIVDDFTSSK